MDKKKKEYIKKHSRFTDLRSRKNKSIMFHRLDGSIRERAALNFLLKDRGNGSLMKTLYTILAMRNEVILPRQNTSFEEQWGAIFRENKEIVDRVLHTVFQWFGTNVGWAELQKIAEVMKDWPNEPSEKLKKSLQKKSV